MKHWIYILCGTMAEGVELMSMREASELAYDARVAEVNALFENPMNEGYVILIVEGADDAEVYGKVVNENAARIYPDCNCDKHVLILNELNGIYGSRLLAIKDADFDRLEGQQYPYSNLLLTDTHDMEGMIVADCLPNLKDENAFRCQSINLDEVYAELEDISYLKWFNHANQSGINFRDIRLNLDLSAYFNAVVENTNNEVNVELTDVAEFKNQHQDADHKEMCNGHDLFERIYVRAKAAKVTNFPKKPFFRDLRAAYPPEAFFHTALFHAIKEWEEATGNSILAVA